MNAPMQVVVDSAILTDREVLLRIPRRSRINARGLFAHDTIPVAVAHVPVCQMRARAQSGTLH